ncbi:MAG: hypothetical protein FJ396_12590 [Verrucomicrobia bacterium]|nr:hypothetical protein [Verrucomicrobiota bacterium]
MNSILKNPLGVRRHMLPAIAASLVALAMQGSLQAQAVSNRLFSENFDGLALGPNREEGLAGLEVWTGTPPSGWVLDNSQMPGFGTPNDGMVEWAGWTFANKDWWVRAAGNQRRAEWAFGDNTVMIADPDEWDDAAHAKGLFNAFIALPSINVKGAAANSLVLAFDSTWRPEAFDDGGANWPVDENGRPINNQNGVVDASFDGGANQRVVDFSSDSGSPNFKKDIDFINESVVVPLNNPAGATALNLRFGMLTAANDWWWAVDNIAVGVPPLLSSVTGNGLAVTNRIVEALGKTVNTSAGVTVTVNGKAATPVEVTRELVNDNYPESERVFVSHTGTQVFAPRSKVAVTVRFTDNTGRVVEENGSFIAPGYLSVSTTPKEITAVLTDAAWMTVKESAGVKLELNGTAITATSVRRVDSTVVVSYVSPSLIPSGSRHTLKATYTTATGQELVETVGFTAATYATLSADLATAPGTGTEAGMSWRTHQLGAARPGGTTLAAAESQLAGALGASEHDASGEVGGVFKINFVNFDQASGEAGNFKASGLAELSVNDDAIPGIPGLNGGLDNIAGQALAFLEIPAAGLYTMVVNSDDGFQVSVGTTNNPKAQILGQFDGGRGSSDTRFYFEAPKAGVYLFRLLWMEGGGGANVEWFTVNADGTRALVNGTQAGALRSFRRRTVSEPGGGTTTPLVFTGIVRNANGSLTLTWTGGGTLQSSPSINGPWTDVTGATSPLTLTPDQATQFARLRR